VTGAEIVVRIALFEVERTFGHYRQGIGGLEVHAAGHPL
jgi:hypothetical protein